jgi:hypothetical protein
MTRARTTYRTNISHILQPLAFVILLVVLYHAWIKPTYFSSTRPSPESAEPRLTDQPLDLLVSADEPFGPSSVPRNRLVELGDAPSRTLGALRDELEKGQVRKVEMALRRLPAKALTTGRVRRYAAALWNNLAIQQERFGGTQLSVSALKEAAALDSRQPTILLNLTQAYWQLRHPAMTATFLEGVIHAAPDAPFPHLAYADLFLEKGQSATASVHLGQARKLLNRDPGIASYLGKLTKNAEAALPQNVRVAEATPPQNLGGAVSASRPSPSTLRPSPAPLEFGRTSQPPATATVGMALAPSSMSANDRPRELAPSSAAHFVVRYEGARELATWERVQAILDYGFNEITQKFGHVPSKPITVVLHTNRKFEGADGSPLWADTLFDRTSGSIHVPVQGALDDLGIFSRIVRHAFVHALLSDYLKGNKELIPEWLMEGLAIRLAEDPWPDLEEEKQKSQGPLRLPSIEREWTQLTGEPRIAAYLAASSATQSLVDRYSIYNVRQVMNLLSTGQTLDAAMRSKLSLSFEQFQRQWENEQQMLSAQR